MHQSVNEQIIKTHEEAKAGDAGNDPFKHVPDLVLHKVALQPVGNVAGCLIGAAFGQGAVLAQLEHLFDAVVPAAGLRRVARVPFRLRQQILNGAVQGEVRIAADRRGEVGV